MPQLDFTLYPGQLFWLAVCFVVLYVLMARYALPQVGEVLDRRKAKIDGDLKKAEQAKEDAEAVVHEYERTLAKAKSDAQKMIQKQTEESAKKFQQKQQKFMADLASKTLIAEEKIRKVRTQADEAIPEIAADLAAVMTGKFTKRKPSKDEVSKKISTITGA